MFFPPDQLVYGVQPRSLIAAAQRLRPAQDDHAPNPVSLLDVRQAFAASSAEATALVATLVREGFLAVTDDRTPDLYLPTRRLNQLSLAKIGPGIQRSTATALLERVLAEAAAINSQADPREATVECIVVFGSYLDETKLHLGDLDLGVAINEPIIRPTPDHSRGETGFFASLLAPTHRCKKRLGLRKPRQVSLHGLDEVRRLNTPYTVVFGKEPPFDEE